MSTYSSIEELNLMLALYPNQKQAIIEEAGNKFQLDGEKHWFVVAEDGNCALFGKDCKIDDLSKVKKITNKMIRDDITSINIPDSVESIGYIAFNSCTSLKSIFIPDSVKSIEDHAFYNCTSLKSINISNLVKSIEGYAFDNCTSLASISIPDSVTYIGDGAFSSCTSLKKIIISNSVESIGYKAFYNCISLKEVIFKGKTLNEVKSMDNYPWGIKYKSILKAER